MFSAAAGFIAIGLQSVSASPGSSIERPTIESQRRLYQYLNKGDSLTIRVRPSKSNLEEVELCADDCDLFTFHRSADRTAVWDSIMLYEVFLSKTNTPREHVVFRDENSDYAHALLDKRAASRSCGDVRETRERVVCVLESIAKNTGLHYSLVRYDEGFRCVIAFRFSRLESPEKSQSRCHRVVK